MKVLKRTHRLYDFRVHYCTCWKSGVWVQYFLLCKWNNSIFFWHVVKREVDATTLTEPGAWKGSIPNVSSLWNPLTFIIIICMMACMTWYARWTPSDWRTCGTHSLHVYKNKVLLTNTWCFSTRLPPKTALLHPNLACFALYFSSNLIA